MSEDFNQALADLAPATPMGRLLRRFWIPFARSQRVAAGGAPLRVRLLGEDFVAFRLADGSVGVMDEACPHRCASLALARNEGDGLRCIFHGWKFTAEGRACEVPNELPEKRETLVRRIGVQGYRTREAGGLLWVLLDREAQSPFPEFEFMQLPPAHVHIRASLVRSHWLQAVESVLDAAHIAFLHRDTVQKALSATAVNNASLWLSQPVPRLEFETTRYGFREAALRTQADGAFNYKLREVVQPWHVMLPGEPGFERQIVTTVPVDATTCLQFIIQLNPYKPLTGADIENFWAGAGPDADDFGKGLPGPERLWGQDRAAMAAGHFTGLKDRHVFCEDFAILESMGGLADRSREHLTQSDGSVILNRQLLVRAARQLAAGESPPCLDAQAGPDVRRLRTTSLNLPAGTAWQTFDVFAA